MQIKNILLIIIIFTIIGCTPEEKYSHLSEKQLYESIKKSLHKNKPALAILHAKDMENRFPFSRSDYAAYANLAYIYATFNNGNYIDTLKMARDFIKIHPTHKKVDFAYYMIGRTYFHNAFQGGGIDNYRLRILNTDFPDRHFNHYNLLGMQTALYEFNKFINLFPNSMYLKNAKNYIRYIRNNFAKHEIQIGNLYLEHKLYIAAANRGRYVIENLQETYYVSDALAIMIESYLKLGLYSLAFRNIQVLKLNFPNSKYFTNGIYLFNKTPYTNKIRQYIKTLSYLICDYDE